MSVHLQAFFNAYMECALWADGGKDSEFTLEEMAEARKECEEFIKRAGSLLDGLDLEQCGHDFYLTRNHHGAGFWDRDLGYVGKALTTLAHSFGETAFEFTFEEEGPRP